MTPDGTTPKRSEESKAAFIVEALDRFHLSDTAEADLRREALECDRFANGDQWDGAVSGARELDGRPCLTIDKTSPAIRQVTNDQRQNRPQVKVSPDDDGNEKTAKILEGMVRHIQVDSNSDIAIDEGFEQTVRGGWGYFRVLTDYVSDKTFEQEIKIKRIKDRFTVYVDPFCMEPDYSDARWYFIVEDMPKKEFKKKNPEASTSGSFLGANADSQRVWIGEDTVRVAEYWYYKEKTTELHELITGELVTDEEISAFKEANPDAPTPPIKRSRELTVKTVCCAKMTAFDILKEYEWAGKFIPIVPILGEDHEIDGKRTLRGLTYRMMDPARMYNYMSSAMVEGIALAPKAPYLLSEGQNEGYEQMWQMANRGSPSVLVYKPTSFMGQPAPPPMRITAEPPIQAMAHAIAQAAEDIMATSGVYRPTLGGQGNETSGRAILARQKQGDTANFNFVDNLTRSIRFLGCILLDLIPKIYDTARIVRIVHEDGTHEQVKINQHKAAGYQGPQPDQAGDDEELRKALEEIHDVTALKYDVVVQTGPSYNTKRQESADTTIQISQAYPQLWDKAGDLMVKFQDWPGASELSERLKKFLPPGIADEKDKTPLPPEVQQQMQQMGQMIEAMTKALNAAHDKLDNKSMEIESKERIAAQNNETKLATTAMQTELANALAVFKEELNHIRSQQQFAHTQEQAAIGNEMQQQALDQPQEAVQTEE